MSELLQAAQIGAMLPELQRQEIERLTPLLYRLAIAEVSQLADAIELRSERGGAVGGNLRENLMRVRGEKVRVAEWHVDDENRCQHKRYSVGNVDRARHGEIGDETWLEAWIA